MKMRCCGLVSGHRVSTVLSVAVLTFAWLFVAPSASAQEKSAAQPPAQSSQQTAAEPASPEPAKTEDSGAAEPKSIGGELAHEKRESTGADEEEHADLKHSFMVQKVAKLTGLSVHQAHLLALGLNFAIIAGIVIWAGRKFLPGMFRDRSASIQQALEEARAASQDANHRLADIENRLRRLDVEIGQMQANAEKDGAAEEVRIQKATEEDIRKVVLAAEQEIATAAKQARRELSTHTAGLAIALARQQINVDSNTDQVLVRSFASKLAPPSAHKDDDGKDGR